jgi:hypothetical protein
LLIASLLKIIELHVCFVKARGTIGIGERNIKKLKALGSIPYFLLLVIDLRPPYKRVFVEYSRFQTIKKRPSDFCSDNIPSDEQSV